MIHINLWPKNSTKYLFKGPLSRTILVPRNSIKTIKASHLQQWHQAFYRPERMVLGVAGEDHDLIVELAKKYFKFGTLPSVTYPEKQRSEFCSTEFVMPPDPKEKFKPGDKKLSHIILGWEGASFISEDMYALAVLQVLLGGGGSFSSGGPGKGMYSRFYRNVLNGNGFVESAHSVLLSYIDSGIFGVHLTATEGRVNDVIDLSAEELLSVAKDLSEEELLRAKNQLKSSIFMTLEQRAALAEDIAKQVFVYGKRHSATYICDRIDKLTVNDLQSILKRILKTTPSLLVYGPGYDSVYSCTSLPQYYERHLS